MHDADKLHDKLNRETGKVSWGELEKAFAQGRVLFVGEVLDLVSVAVSVSEDDVQAVREWMNTGQLRQVASSEAEVWSASNQVFWAVVVAPWVLIQVAKPQ
ncbi:MAG: DUF2288 family protein [Pseudomonadales bacterium]|nr:DUF2288 family protein [Pseudomonadales bacterium]